MLGDNHMVRYTAHSLFLTTLEIRCDGTPVATVEPEGSFFQGTRHWVAHTPGENTPIAGRTLTDCLHAFVAAREGKAGHETIPVPTGTRAEIIV